MSISVTAPVTPAAPPPTTPKPRPEPAKPLPLPTRRPRKPREGVCPKR